MPIYKYVCSFGHESEALVLPSEKEPEFCDHSVVLEPARGEGQIITYVCGLPLKKSVSVGSWKYTRGKNIIWP